MTPRPPVEKSFMESFGSEECIAFVNSLTDAEKAALAYDWPKWARPKQLPPAGDWDGWLVLSGRGFGKALAIDTPIPTVDGWKQNGDLVAGDVLFDESGRKCTVLMAHPVMIGRPCYRVRFSDGSQIIADAEHLWTTIDRRTRKAMGRRVSFPSRKKPSQWVPRHRSQTLTTAEIAATLYDGDEVNHAIPCAAPLQLPEANLAIDPYLLGCWLGDGSSSGAEITTADMEIVSAFASAGHRMPVYSQTGGARVYGIVENGFRVALRAAGVLDKKHIPREYLRASESQRRALLQGLFDTDGYCSPRTGSSEFCSVDQRLALDVRELALSLGYKAVVYMGRATINGRDCGAKYRVCFTAHADKNLFRLQRKLSAQPKRGAQAERAYRRYIVAVEPVASVPVRCITVDSPSRLYLASEAMIPTHNTRTGAEWVRDQAESDPQARIALVGETSADGKDVMVAGESGILACCPPWNKPEFSSSHSSGRPKLTWPNGAVATLYDAREPDQLRGPQHTAIWFDELFKFRYSQEVFDQAMFGLRLGNRPRFVATSTPRPIPLLKRMLRDDHIVVTRGTSYENLRNLAHTYRRNVIDKYAGTRLGRQEIEAEVLEDIPGALWTQRNLDDNRVRIEDVPPLARVVVAIDPAITSGDSSNETGIVCGGMSQDQHGYLIEDASMRGTPDMWARRAVSLYRKYEADRIVAEANQGGEMVERVIRAVAPDVPITLVRATRGKYIRAEPVSALYEQGRISHIGTFPDLENQMCAFTPEMAATRRPGEEKDRADACLHQSTGILCRAHNRAMILPIPEVLEGYEVMTRQGWRRVTWAGQTRADAPLFEVLFSDGRTLLATAEHPIFIEEKGFVPVDALVWGDTVCAWNHQLNLSSTAGFIGASQIQNTKPISAITFAAQQANPTIAHYGPSTTGTFRRDAISITSTGTGSTTPLKILPVSHVKNMAQPIRAKTWNRSGRLWTMRGPSPTFGMGVPKAERGIQSMAKKHGKAAKRWLSEIVTVAGDLLRHFAPTERGQDFALASAIGGTLTDRNDTQLRPFARFAAPSSEQENGAERPKPARVYVERVTPKGRGPVYNLHVDGVHEFYANGILVHNCVWLWSDLFDAMATPQRVAYDDDERYNMQRDFASDRNPTTGY